MSPNRTGILHIVLTYVIEIWWQKIIFGFNGFSIFISFSLVLFGEKCFHLPPSNYLDYGDHKMIPNYF